MAPSRPRKWNSSAASAALSGTVVLNPCTRMKSSFDGLFASCALTAASNLSATCLSSAGSGSSAVAPVHMAPKSSMDRRATTGSSGRLSSREQASSVDQSNFPAPTSTVITPRCICCDRLSLKREGELAGTCSATPRFDAMKTGTSVERSSGGVCVNGSAPARSSPTGVGISVLAQPALHASAAAASAVRAMVLAMVLATMPGITVIRTRAPVRRFPCGGCGRPCS